MEEFRMSRAVKKKMSKVVHLLWSHFFGKNETKDNFYVRYVYTHLEKSLKKEFGKWVL